MSPRNSKTAVLAVVCIFFCLASCSNGSKNPVDKPKQSVVATYQELFEAIEIANSSRQERIKACLNGKGWGELARYLDSPESDSSVTRKNPMVIYPLELGPSTEGEAISYGMMGGGVSVPAFNTCSRNRFSFISRCK